MIRSSSGRYCPSGDLIIKYLYIYLAIKTFRSKLPLLRAIVLYDEFDGDTRSLGPGVITWEQLMKIGKDQNETRLRERLGNIAVNQCCVLGYTSGT